MESRWAAAAMDAASMPRGLAIPVQRDCRGERSPWRCGSCRTRRGICCYTRGRFGLRRKCWCRAESAGRARLFPMRDYYAVDMLKDEDTRSEEEIDEGGHVVPAMKFLA